MTAADGLLHEEFHSPAFTRSSRPFRMVQRASKHRPRNVVPDVEGDVDIATGRITARRALADRHDERVSPHILRHSTAMEPLQQGVDQTLIALWLGRESIETTQVYIHAPEARPGRYRPARPRSAIISTRSRRLSLNRRYQRTHKMTIPRSKWRPLEQLFCDLQLAHCRPRPTQRVSVADRTAPFAPEPRI
jgi:hypothetical protein